jgi:hypothetical protein
MEDEILNAESVLEANNFNEDVIEESEVEDNG